MRVPTELVRSHSQGGGENGEKEQVSGASRWVTPEPGASRTQRTWQASRTHVGDAPSHGGVPGVCGQCDPCRELAMHMPWALSLSTLRPRLLKGHKNTFLLSQFHASLFYFGCTRRAETPKPLSRHEVSEPRGGAWDPSSICPPPRPLPPIHTPSILSSPCSPSWPQPASPHVFPELGSSLLIEL